jgi:hypothetical protein
MQASKISLRNDYAAKVQGKEVAVRVMEMVTQKTTSGTTNYLIVYVFDNDTDGKADLTFLKDEKGNVCRFQIEVSAVIDTLDNHQRLMAERKAHDDARRAEVAKAKDKQMTVVKLLAKALGAQAVEDRYGSKYDRHAPAVLTDGDALEVNEAAYDDLIAFLRKQGVTDDNVVVIKRGRA